jgi:hypothetical protein
MAKNRKETEQAGQAALVAEAVMYVGPSKLGRLHVQQGTVFKDGLLPQAVQDLSGESRDFARLLVPIHQAGEARAQLRNPKSLLAKAFASVARLEV